MRNILASIGVALGIFASPPALAPKDPRGRFMLPEFHDVGYAQDRCCNKGCVTKITRGKKALVAIKMTDAGTTSVFFDENGYTLSSEGMRKASHWLR